MPIKTYIAEFTKDHPGVLAIELESLRSAFGDFEYEFLTDNAVIFRGSPESISESAFMRYYSEVIWSGLNLEDAAQLNLPGGRFYIRAAAAGKNSVSIERELGAILGGQGRISFSTPDFVIRAYWFDRWYIGIQVGAGHRKDMEKRTAPMRPFFSPVSMHPFLARLLVNLSHTKRGELILDPFCGTGGILIEAAVMGRQVIGADASLSMVSGARMNLRYYGVEPGRVVHSSIEKLEIGVKVDAIATDLPYGRSSPMFHVTENFLADTVAKFSDLLRDGGYSVVVSNTRELEQVARSDFQITNVIALRVHKSLTRFVHVFKKLSPELHQMPGKR